jgi:transposase
MKGFYLNQGELEALHKARKQERNKSYAYRIHAVILLGTGYTLKKVREVLFIDDETLRTYAANYRTDGVAGLLSDNRNGKACQLSDSQIEELTNELDAVIHLQTGSVIQFVKEHFDVCYSASGMRDLLHRLNYVYKKPKLVPGNPDVDAQELFAEQYDDFMLSKPDDVEVVFVDAVHPEHNALAAYGWIKRGETRELKTNSGRQRLNLHGAINAETHETIIIESDTVDSCSTLTLLTAIENQYPAASSIKVILDNAKYHYSKVVREYIATSRIDLVFLPSYSPNLNLIERLWGFFKKKVLYNTYYAHVGAFREACIKFFRGIDRYSSEIANFMTADFHIE